MGLGVKKVKIDVQKERLTSVIVSMIHTNISIMEFQLTISTKKEEIFGIKKLIKISRDAIDIVKNIQHYEILVSLYNSFVNGKEAYYVALVKSITHKQTIRRWDKTKKGFEEFLKMEEEAIKKTDDEREEKRRTAEMIKNAKAEGKKVEMMYVDGKIKPVIVNEKPN